MKKTILITGSTDGIGKLTANLFAKDGHEVYLHGRNPNKLAETINEIKTKSGNKLINGFVSDFSDLESVSLMADQIAANLPQLDVLINNAGIFKSQQIQNKNGLDIRMTVNYLASYILTNRLMELLRASSDSRILNLSSAAQSTVSLNVLQGKETQPQPDTYAQSKLALTMWSFYLAKKEPDVSVIAVNPGSLLNTKMVQEAYGNSWATADKGADILYDLAFSEKYESVTGKYYDNDKGNFDMAHRDAYDDALIADLVNVTNNLLKDL